MSPREAKAGQGVLGLARLLVAARLRSLWNGWRAPRRPSLRVAWLMMLAAPVAYVGLFATALAALRAPNAQQTVLALVCAAIGLASCLSKAAASEAVVAGSGENEFLLTRPLGLGRLVLARSLANTATDLFSAFFLLPILLAASLAWNLGLAGVLVGIGTSVLAQIGLAALAQGLQIGLVRLVRPARRRTLWAVLALLAALAMAAVWVLGTQVIRAPVATARALSTWASVLSIWPLDALSRPLNALAHMGLGAAVIALAGLAVLVAIILTVVLFFVRWAAHDGWEHAGLPWVEAGAPTGRSGPLTPFGKEVRLLTRDRSRLVTLAVAPAIFVGIQVFGSAGWEWITSSPRHAAVMSFSLAAYMATYGPLGHMAAERQAFWILRMSPAPLGRLMAWKALFWALVVGGTAAAAYASAFCLSPLRASAAAVEAGVLVLAGAVLVAGLAVAMGCRGADLSDDHRPALGPGTVWLFMFTAALFNVALLGDGQVRARAIILYVLCVALHWATGMEHAASVYDPEAQRRGPPLAGDGASLAILLYLGQRSGHLALGSRDQAVLASVWAGILGITTLLYLWRCSLARAQRGWLTSLALSLVIGAAGAFASPRSLWQLNMSGAVALLTTAIAEELIFRGIVQRSLAERWRERGTTGVLGAFALSLLLSLVAGARPLSPGALVAAGVGAAAYALSGRATVALLARLALEILP
jgi:membrane protease YdiL (CAAX protease family)